MDGNYNFLNKKADLVNISNEQKQNNIDSLLGMGEQFDSEMAGKSVWATNKIVNNMEATGASKYSDAQKQRLKGMNARSTASNILYNQKGSDSVKMQRVKYYVEGVEQLIARERDKKISKEFIDELDIMLNMAAVSCKSYIDNLKKRENERKANVRMAYQGVLFEISRMHVIKEKIKTGEYANKKVSDVYVTVSGEIPAAKYYKKPEEGKTIGSVAKKAAGFFSESFDPYTLLKPLNGNPSALKKSCKGLRDLKNVLRGFKKNRAETAELTINGNKFTILQKPDNKLYIVDKYVEQPLDLPADLVIDRIESEIIENEENFGDFSVREIFLDISLSGKKENEITPNDYQRINRLCIAYIRKVTNMDDNDYGNVSTELLLKWARRLACHVMTPEQLQNEYKQLEKDILEHVNDTTTAQLEKNISKEKVEESVVIKEEQKEVLQDEEKNWSADEQELLNLIADMFFDSDTMSADKLTNKKLDESNSLRKRLGKYGDLFLEIMNDPRALYRLIDRLPLPDIKVSFGHGKPVTLKKYMRDCFQEVFESQEIAAIKNSFVYKNAMKASFKLDNIESVPFVGQEIYDMFDSVAYAVEKMVLNVTSKLQDVAKEIADDTFDEKKNNIEQVPDTLEGMLDQLTRGGAAQSRFNKEIMYNYFKDASLMDKRSMMASMVRNAKPEKSLVPNDAELIDELKERPESVGFFKDEENLTRVERNKLEWYRNKKTQSNICINLLGGMLKGAGPLMQKMVQGLPEAILPKEMVEAIKDMKSNLNPIPENIVKLKMASIVEASAGTIEKIEVDKSLGAASMGQAFLCTVYGKKFPEGKKVVIKLLRSDARNRMQRESKLMKKYADKADVSGSVLKSYQGQLRGFMKELNFTKEAKNVKDGSAFDGKLPDVEAMKLSNILGPGADYIMLDVAEGETVDRFLKNVDEKIEEARDPFLKKVRIGNKTYKNRRRYDYKPRHKDTLITNVNKLKEDLKELQKRRDHVLSVCEVTIKEAVLGSGFYHGDLHSGNIMVTDKKATVIDFGNAVQLSKKTSKWITALSVSAMTSDAKLFMEGFENILKEENRDLQLTGGQKTQLTAEFRRILSMGTQADMGNRLMVCMLKAQDMGYTIPTSVFNFAQGQMRLMNTVNEMNKKVEKLKTTIKELKSLGYLVDDEDLQNLHKPEEPEKDYCDVMQKIVSDKTFVIKLAANIGGSLSKKLLNSMK